LSVPDPDIPLQRTLIFHLLLKRSRALKGFPKKQFHLEFSRIFLVCAVLEVKGMAIKSNDNFYEYNASKEIDNLAWNVLIQMLKAHPL